MTVLCVKGRPLLGESIITYDKFAPQICESVRDIIHKLCARNTKLCIMINWNSSFINQCLLHNIKIAHYYSLFSWDSINIESISYVSTIWAELFTFKSQTCSDDWL